MTPDQLTRILHMSKTRRLDYIQQYRREHGEEAVKKLINELSVFSNQRSTN